MDYDKSKFERGKLNLISQPIFYVEGKSNKVFYQSLEELSLVNIENGGSCSQIKKKVNSQTNSYGIVDRDYLFHTESKIFPINFYSIENVSLIYIDELKELRMDILDFIDIHTIDTVRHFHTSLEINSDVLSKRVIDYNLNLSSEHHTQFSGYITKNIVCNNSFIRYANMKKVVDKYVKFYKSKNRKKIKYVTDLINYIPSRSVNSIFDFQTRERLITVLSNSI